MILLADFLRSLSAVLSLSAAPLLEDIENEVTQMHGWTSESLGQTSSAIHTGA